MWDETFYMATGIFGWDHNFRFYEGSPLYSYIYRVTWHFIHDPAILHLWMGVAVVGAAMIATSFSVMVISRNLAFTAIATVIMLASGYSEALPKLVYAAIAIMSIGFAASTMMPRFHTKMACVALTAFIVTFIRPEFVIAFYAATAISVLALTASYRTVLQDRPWSATTISFLAIIAALSRLWAFPVLSGGARALQAFGQHYSLYLFNMGKFKIDPFLNYERVLAEYLPGATSEMDALKKYPAKIIGYFAYNIGNGIKSGFGAVAGIAINHPVITVAVVALAIYCFAKRNRGPLNYGDCAAWLIIAAPTAMSIALIFARDHYLVVAATLLMLLASIFVKWIGSRDTAIGAAAVLVLTAILVNSLPLANQIRVETAMALRAQPPFGALLELDGGWCYYAPRHCHSIYVIDAKTDNMVRYLDETHINGVMVSAPMRRWAMENNQPQFADFLNNGAPGWTRIPLSAEYSLLRRDNLDTAAWANIMTGNLMRYVHVNHIGRRIGTVSQINDTTLFIHPGIGDPTSLTIDLGMLAKDYVCSRIDVTARLDKKLTPNTIAESGGAVIGVSFYSGQVGQRGIVRYSHDMNFSAKSTSPPLMIRVDDHGNPNNDWLNLDIKPSGCGT